MASKEVGKPEKKAGNPKRLREAHTLEENVEVIKLTERLGQAHVLLLHTQELFCARENRKKSSFSVR